MITITKPSDLEKFLNHLPFTTQESLRYHLIEACSASSMDADQFWQTSHTCLYCLEKTDTLDLLEQQKGNLDHLLTYPEFMIALPEDYRLLLCILNDEGKGQYLLFPRSIDCQRLQAFLAQMENTDTDTTVPSIADNPADQKAL